MEYSPSDLSMYRTLSGAVIPRPIAWVSTRDADGRNNLAPFSYFTIACVDPPVIAFAPVHHATSKKDTPANAVETGEFAVNVVVEQLVEPMNQTSATLGADESEFDAVGIEPSECTVVDAPYVEDAPVTFECTLYDTVEFPTSTMIFGEVVHVHLDESVLTDGKLDVRKLQAVGRLAGGYYLRSTDRFSLERPK